MRLIGSFQTITIHGRSGIDSSSVDGSWTSAGAADIAPSGYFDAAHRMFGQGGDRQARGDADVGRDRRAVADEQVLVAEDALVGVHDAGGRVGSDHRPAEDVGRARD